MNKMNETIWLGNTVRVGSNTPRYLYHTNKNTIEFRTLKDKLELGWLDEEKGVLYLNKDYETQFKAVKRQIKKDFDTKITKITEYIGLI
jgi:hypothetical protein